MTNGESSAQRVHCAECKAYLGWTFVGVSTSAEEYKLGRHLLELEALVYLPQDS